MRLPRRQYVMTEKATLGGYERGAEDTQSIIRVEALTHRCRMMAQWEVLGGSMTFKDPLSQTFSSAVDRLVCSSS